MTYFGYLLGFLGVPIALLSLVLRLYHHWGLSLPPWKRAWPPVTVIALHVMIALVYTTPWDNYLVATRVWWYNPQLVAGITFGWVPIEEYTFFILQPILAGLWLVWLGYHSRPVRPFHANPGIRWISVALIGSLWLAAVAILVSNWQPGTYVGLELVWALPPILLQLAVGADILWHYRRWVLTAIAVPTIYLVATDWLAISSGTWTIDPMQSLNWFIAGKLPIEEAIFFLLTNTLVIFGVSLAMVTESHQRLFILWKKFQQKRKITIQKKGFSS